MQKSFLQKLLDLPLEEKILNSATVVGATSVLFPWIGGEWLGGTTVVYSGLGFFTSFMGMTILAVLVYVLLITVVPLAGGPRLIRSTLKPATRLFSGVLASVLTVSVWSVHTKFTFEFSRMQIYFGLYSTLIACLIVTLYAFLLLGDTRRNPQRHAREDDIELPAASEIEEHRLR